MSRRVWLTALVSGAGAVSASCQSPTSQVMETADGQVLHWEGDELIVLVSGFQPAYRVGETIAVTVIANNQGAQVLDVRVRIKILGLGDQPVIQSEPTLLSIAPGDAGKVEQSLPIARSTQTGTYTLSVEIPPWKVGGREVGKGATLRAPLRFDSTG